MVGRMVGMWGWEVAGEAVTTGKVRQKRLW